MSATALFRSQLEVASWSWSIPTSWAPSWARTTPSPTTATAPRRNMVKHMWNTWWNGWRPSKCPRKCRNWCLFLGRWDDLANSDDDCVLIEAVACFVDLPLPFHYFCEYLNKRDKSIDVCWRLLIPWKVPDPVGSILIPFRRYQRYSECSFRMFVLAPPCLLVEFPFATRGSIHR